MKHESLFDIQVQWRVSAETKRGRVKCKRGRVMCKRGENRSAKEQRREEKEMKWTVRQSPH